MDLSIIIPIYNVEKYLEECLESIYSIKEIKKEVILVNDGSRDDSYKIIEKYQKIYRNETVVINKINGGLSSARNSGLKIARGKYVSFIDSDDFIITEIYEKFVREGLKSDADYIVGSGVKFGENISEEIFYRDKNIEKKIYNGKELFKILIEKKSYLEEVWDDLYKREFLLEHNLKFEEGLLHEDSLFTPQVLIAAKKALYLPYNFYMYRQRENSIMKSIKVKNQEDKLYIVNKLIDIYLKEDILFCTNSLIRTYYTVAKTEIQDRKLLKKLFKLRGKSINSWKRLIKCYANFLKIRKR